MLRGLFSFIKVAPFRGPRSRLLKYGALAVTLAYAIDSSRRANISCIEDKTTIDTRKAFSYEIRKLQQEFGQMAIYPQVRISTRGNMYIVEFELDPRKCDTLAVLAGFLSHFQDPSQFRLINNKTVKKENMLTMQIEFEQNDPRTKTPNKGTITLTGITTGDHPSFRLIFEKSDVVTSKDTSAMLASYRQSIKPRQVHRDSSSSSLGQQSNTVRRQPSSQTPKKHAQVLKKLQEMGVTVFNPEDKINDLDWDFLAGYERQKRDIEDTILLALNFPQVYEGITEGTRMKKEPNAPKAVLFEGPPGTGKTTSAKIIAKQVKIPLIYLPLEAIMSKFYGQSEKQLADVWQACHSLGRVIIFIDEIDALAGSRSSDMHEASRRVLSTLLRKIDSFESTTDVLLICATNRKHDLDPAMLSRIDLSIKFDLPDRQSRAAIFQRYAKHLTDKDRDDLAAVTDGFSGRNISDVCKRTSSHYKDAQRRWASKLIRQQVSDKLPDLAEYVNSLNVRIGNSLA